MHVVDQRKVDVSRVADSRLGAQLWHVIDIDFNQIAGA